MNGNDHDHDRIAPSSKGAARTGAGKSVRPTAKAALASRIVGGMLRSPAMEWPAMLVN
jgi:hypothetical protein